MQVQPIILKRGFPNIIQEKEQNIHGAELLSSCVIPVHMKTDQSWPCKQEYMLKKYSREEKLYLIRQWEKQ